MAFINKISPVYSHWHTEKLKCNRNPRTYKGVCACVCVCGGGGGGGGCPPKQHTQAFPLKVFLSFFLDDKTSEPKELCSCSFIPRTRFEISLGMVSYYGYEI